MAGATFEFGAFRLDAATGRLTHGDDPVALPDRHRTVLARLLASAGDVVSKDALIAAAWDVAVTDNSLEQVISAIRRALGAAPDGRPWIDTVPRRGYRFAGEVRRRVARESDEALDALLAPHRAFVEGRAALETLDAGRVDEARRAFERVLDAAPDEAPAHLGLANACLMRFETTRADPSPDRAALDRALRHAREACRLDARSGEAWATLGLVLDRSGASVDAVAAARRAVALEPDTWRHHFRLATVAWGEERLRAAHRTLALLPGFPLAHWLAATVLVARQALDEAARELDAGLAAGTPDVNPSFRPVGLHWLLGLIRLAQGDRRAARTELEAELAVAGASGHLYARETTANTWYALGALHRRAQRPADALAAFSEALRHGPDHPLARLALGPDRSPGDSPLEHGVQLVLAGHVDLAAALLDQALAQAPPGGALWTLPIEPLLAVADQPARWAPALRRLRARAA